MSDRDPLYPQILERLRGELNPQDFEDAVCDLLRDAYPSLVPIRGGRDAGRDGAIADGEAFPLVCTTGIDVIGNLTASLDSYLEHGGKRRKVVLATSQELTPRRRSNLEKRANEKGFTLDQVVDQRGIADRLYHEKTWRLKLLGLAGAPAALSVVPLSRRLFLDLSPVGRDDDLVWMQTTAGDRVLSGQPGSGKTFLLHHLIREGWPGLFLVSRDEAEIANALRAQAPGFVVIVDDAHAELDALVPLRRLREEIGAGFTILATTWEGNLDSVVERLGLTAEVRELELLTRPEILEIYRQAGITEVNTDRELLRELVDQASNRPGLAATLALLWLRGNWREVLSGNALSRNVSETFRSLIGDEAAPLLATFALGGDRGMDMTAVGELLGISLAEIWRQTASLAAGGTLFAIEREVHAVRPHQLRSALIGTVFFPEHGTPLPYQRFLDRAPSLGSAIAALVQARINGVPVPDAELRDLVSRADALDPVRKMKEDQTELSQLIVHSDVYAAWQGLTLSNEENARWVLDHYSGDPLHLAPEALFSAPRAIIPRLLARVPSFPEPMHAREDHPLKILSRWISKPLREPEKSLQRRGLLGNEIAKYLRKGGSQAVGLRAVSVALSPRLETSSLDPGIGNVVTLSRGVLSERTLRELGSLWAAVRRELVSLPSESWPSLATVLWELVQPEHLALGVQIPEGVIRTLHDLAVTVIRDLAPMVRERPGLASELYQFAERLGLAIDLPGDPVFETLFPPFSRQTMPAPDETSLLELASTWSGDSARHVAQRLARYEREARDINRHWPWHIRAVVRVLATLVDDQTEWLAAFLEEGLPGDLAEPFLQEVLKRRPEGWEHLFEKWLATPAWNGTVSALIAGSTGLPERLKEKALSTLEAQPRLTYVLALRNEICAGMLRALLLSGSAESAAAAAVGLWSAQGEIPLDLMDEWRQAVVRAPGTIEAVALRSSLDQVLTDNPDLACEWLHHHFGSAAGRPVGETPSAALSVLDEEQRKSLLADLVSPASVSDFIAQLVDKNLALYCQLLERADLREHHLTPLQGLPEAEWIPLALAAAEAGWEAEQIAEATIWGPAPHSYGLGPAYWSDWKKSFVVLENDPHEAIRAIGRAGRKLVQPLIQEAAEREKKVALYGP